RSDDCQSADDGVSQSVGQLQKRPASESGPYKATRILPGLARRAQQCCASTTELPRGRRGKSPVHQTKDGGVNPPAKTRGRENEPVLAKCQPHQKPCLRAGR